MLIQFTKHTHKKHVIKYIRDNGTITWMHADDFFVQHDLSHFALEKTLGYTTAFCGMINAGMQLNDFENRAVRTSLIITEQAAHAENMANLFVTELTQGNFEDFNGALQAAYHHFNRAFKAPFLNAETIDAIRSYFCSLIYRWHQLESGDTLTVEF